jgi:hypothetical protein
VTIGFLALDLDRWDEIAADALVVTMFRDERPLRGAAGLCDWRLGGRLSRLVQDDRVGGAEGEALLMPGTRRLPFARVLVAGLGRQGSFDDAAYKKHLRWIRDAIRRAGIRDYAIQPPGRATGLVAARRALEMWLESSDAATDDGERVLLIDTPAAHKDMADLLHGRERPRPTTAPPPRPA